MKTPVPIYAKIVGWFFLNLLCLGVAYWFFIARHHADGAAWLLNDAARERVIAMASVLDGELNTSPQKEWDEILNRQGTAYKMKIALWENRGRRLAGDSFELPPEIKRTLATDPHQQPPPQRRPPHPEFSPLDAPLPGESFPQARPPRQQHRPPRDRSFEEEAKAELIRTSAPSRHWLLVHAPFGEDQRIEPAPTTLIGQIDSITASGLFAEQQSWLPVAAAIFVFSALFWLPLVRSLTRATKQMTEATERIAQGDFDVQVNEKRRDELGRLGAAINQMAARLSGFVRGQKRFLGDIAHELCSPLARMEMALGVLEQRAPADLNERITDVQDEVREMRELVNELLNFSKAGLQGKEAPLESLDLSAIIRNVVERDRGDAEVIIDSHDDLRVLGARTLVTRAISNVIRNAVRYAGTAGPVTISTRPHNGHVVISVTDEGPGVPPESLPQLFDAFYRPDTARNRSTGGAGLGLAIVKTCIEACKGTVTARNREGSGLEVSMTLSRSV